ncbi:MAG: YfhO family protein, partial [Armatimonadetes bacterium]|nr:YfhO family protein [Armatimonadota bacterium]
MRRILPPAIFIGLVCLLLWPVVFQGRVLLPGGMLHGMLPWSEYAGKGREIDWIPLCWDSLAQYLPERMLLGQAIRSGELPLWNPYKMCGVPFLADPQTAVLYPPNLLYAFVPPDLAFTILAIVHLVGAGLFTYIFVRGLGLSRAASVFAGIAFMLSGFGIVWLELPVFMSSGVWLPLALHLMRLACEKRSPLRAAGAAITLALSLVGGHPQIALYTWLVAGLYWMCLLASTNNKRTVGAMIGLGFLAFGIGAALAAPQLLPSFELASISHRGGSAPTNLGYIAYVSRAMPIWRSIVLIAPDFFGNPSKGGMWVGGEYAEYCGYVGILPLVLIPVAFLAKGKRLRDACFFGFVLILALLLSMGAPICRVLYFLVPGFSHSGSPARALFLFCFAASVLASLGLQQLLISRNENGKRTRVTIILSTIAIMIALVGLWLANAARFVGDQPYATVFWELLSSVYLPLTFLILGTFLLLLVSTSKIGYKVGQLIIIAVL